jgi:predicted transcriptional regulator
MTTLTIRLPEDKHHRLKMLAEKRHISLNKLFEELSTIVLTEYDAETHFQIRAQQGSTKKGLELLDKLDKHFKKKPQK